MAIDQLRDAPASAPKEDDAPDNDIANRVGERSREQELKDVDAGLGALDRAVNRVAEVLGVGVLVAIVSIIFANAAGRYAWNSSLTWAEELVLLLMPWLGMIGTFLAVRRGTMIRIEYFYTLMPAAIRRPVAFAGYILCVTMLVFLGVVATRVVLLYGSYPSVILGIPTGWSSAALAVGAFAVAGAFLAILLRESVEAWRGNGDES